MAWFGWDGYGESGAIAKDAVDLDFPTEGRGGHVYDGETYATAHDSATIGGTVEGFEDVLLLFVGHAEASVDDFDFN